MKPKKLYIFTGKGGVGKTTLSLAFAKALKSHGHNVLYTYLKSGTFSEAQSNDPMAKIATDLDIPYWGVDLQESIKKYIAKKLKSQTIAKWIAGTALFKAIANMIPGFSYLILIGQILDEIENTPGLTIILDSPSSGHALTMMESTHNFKNIFQSGIVFEDNQKMLNLIYAPEYTQINIITLPGQLAVSEAIELKENILKLGEIDCRIISNNGLLQYLSKSEDSLPNFLQQKLSIEKELLDLFGPQMTQSVKHSLANNYSEQINDLAHTMTKLI